MTAKHEEMSLHKAPPSVAKYMVQSQKKEQLIIAGENGGPHGGGSIDSSMIQSIYKNQKLAAKKRPRGAAAQTAGAPPLKILKALTI